MILIQVGYNKHKLLVCSVRNSCDDCEPINLATFHGSRISSFYGSQMKNGLQYIISSLTSYLATFAAQLMNWLRSDILTWENLIYNCFKLISILYEVKSL